MNKSNQPGLWPPPEADAASAVLHQHVGETLFFLPAAKAPFGCKKEEHCDAIYPETVAIHDLIITFLTLLARL